MISLCIKSLVRLPDLIEPVFAAIADINHLDDLRRQPQIEHVTLAEFRLEIRATCKDQTRHVDLVVRNEMLDGVFGYFSNIVVTFFISETRETKRRLSTTTVLFR